MYIPDSIVPGGGLEFSHPTENKQVIENYASNKRPKLPIRGYLVRIRYTPFCPQFDSDYGYIYTAHRAHSLLPRLFSQIDAPLPGGEVQTRARLFQKADCSGPRIPLKRDDRKSCVALFQKVWVKKQN
jgi:hypothetical protein